MKQHQIEAAEWLLQCLSMPIAPSDVNRIIYRCEDDSDCSDGMGEEAEEESNHGDDSSDFVHSSDSDSDNDNNTRSRKVAPPTVKPSNVRGAILADEVLQNYSCVMNGLQAT